LSCAINPINLDTSEKKGEVSMDKKRILIFIVFLLVVSTAVYAEPMEVLNPSFEYLNGVPVTIKTMGFTPDDWTFASGCDDDGIEAPSSEGDVCVAVGGEDSVYQLLEYTIAPGDEYTLTFDTYFLWSETTWDCTFQGRLYYDDIGERVVIDYVEGNLIGYDYTWHTDYTVYTNIPSDSPAIGKQLGIELASFPTGSGTWFGFDNVRMEGELGGSVKCIYPPNGSQNIPINANLEWGPPTYYTPVYYDVYFGDDANELSPDYFLTDPVIEQDNVTTYNPPGNLDNATFYYWRVDAYEPNDVGTILHVGRVWSFATVSEEPVIITQPVGVTVAAGESAVLTIEAISATSYEWYKVALPDDVLIDSGETLDTLVLTDVQPADEGQYYCKLLNADTGKFTDSDAVQVMTKRLISHWKFEDDLTDEVGKDEVNIDGDWPGIYVDPNEGAPTPTPVYWYVDDANSIDGKALYIPGDGKHVQIPGSESIFNFYVNGFTISSWIRIEEDPSGWDTYLARGYWINACSGGWTNVGLSSAIWSDGPVLSDGGWHLTVSSYDSETSTLSHYVDGVKNSESVQYPWLTDEPLVMGALDTLGTNPYMGLLDDVNLWSYPLDPVTIAMLYVDKNPGEMVCMEPVPNDFNDDCKVDIADFVEMLSAWLECNRVPSEDCY
jgi:hypothetical protein